MEDLSYAYVSYSIFFITTICCVFIGLCSVKSLSRLVYSYYHILFCIFVESWIVCRLLRCWRKKRKFSWRRLPLKLKGPRNSLELKIKGVWCDSSNFGLKSLSSSFLLFLGTSVENNFFILSLSLIINFWGKMLKPI